MSARLVFATVSPPRLFTEMHFGDGGVFYMILWAGIRLMSLWPPLRTTPFPFLVLERWGGSGGLFSRDCYS